MVAVAATRRPDLVRSLVLVEPAMHAAAGDHPDVAAMPERFNDLLRATWAVPGSGEKW